jgi:hypothetical protein
MRNRQGAKRPHNDNFQKSKKSKFNSRKPRNEDRHENEPNVAEKVTEGAEPKEIGQAETKNVEEKVNEVQEPKAAEAQVATTEE